MSSIKHAIATVCDMISNLCRFNLMPSDRQHGLLRVCSRFGKMYAENTAVARSDGRCLQRNVSNARCVVSRVVSGACFLHCWPSTSLAERGLGRSPRVVVSETYHQTSSVVVRANAFLVCRATWISVARLRHSAIEYNSWDTPWCTLSWSTLVKHLR